MKPKSAENGKLGGRPKGSLNKATADIRALAQQYAPAAIKELARLSIKAESEQARVAATKEILDRAYGKPAQSVNHSGSIGTYDLTKVPDDQLAQLRAILGAAALADGDRSGDRA